MSGQDWGDWSDTSNQWNQGGYGQQDAHQQPQAPYSYNYQEPQQSTAVPNMDYYSQQQSQFGGMPQHGHGQQPQHQQLQAPFAGNASGFMGGGFQQQFMADSVMNAAKQFGGQFAEEQKEKFSKVLSSFHLKYYFAVDNSYVGKKLAILLFPFLHKDWSVRYSNSDEPVPARMDVNAPDLYIPLMAFVTYILLSGFVLGTQNRFSPEQLGMLTSNALIYLIIENVIVLITKYVMNISQALSLWHSLAFTTYKYPGMILSLLMFLLGGKSIYYATLAYTSFAIVFFLLRTIKTFILDSPQMYDSHDAGRKRRLYLILFICFSQPFIMWLLTSSATSFTPGNYDFAHMAMKGMGLGGQKVPLLPDGEVDYEALLKMP
ncbi:hypothetical protein QR680_006266 [Steinernema hermaphroditum]|uniref:Protein YIF1 n=1 Tax=Steinernema hermaphroditum TaxID=289476 RepID=A0AA39HW91_9BILA|nr:hypothetical protein QR680_006266 [Steinernema hermaphroditum]